jgi:phosphoserine phosphatase RsbU/P
VPVTTPARILIYADDQTAAGDMPRLLERAGHIVAWQVLESAEADNLSTSDLIIVQSGQTEPTSEQCGRLRSRLADRFVPILLVGCEQNPATRVKSLQSGADACLLGPLVDGELVAQVQALIRLKRLHDRVAEKQAESHRITTRLQKAYQQIDQELQLARRIQQSLLPQELPELEPARFAVHYRPCGRVGGDFYDVFRLDENHVGFYIADVMGHGVPASLLTIFLKKAIKTKEINGHSYRLLPPHEVLQRLNRELIEHAVAENPFITMIYGLFDRREQTVAFARAGHPHPLYVPRSGKPECWTVHGTLLGVFETQFTTQTHELLPGDKLLLYTDGLEDLSGNGNSNAIERLLTCAEKHRTARIEEFIEQLSIDLVQRTGQPDDFTLLGLEMAT